MKPMTYGEIRKNIDIAFAKADKLIKECNEAIDKNTAIINENIALVDRERVRRGMFTVEDITEGR